MSLSNCVLHLPRALVSQNKRRFREDGFDLDLCYIHPRIIVMGFPSTGLEQLYRNPRNEVVRLLDERHEDHYQVYNFCSEASRCYSSSVFHGRVQHFPVEDHNVPQLDVLFEFCEDAAAFLNANAHNVVALHCKAGKGRGGMMACALLVRMGFCQSACEAIALYNRQRVMDYRGLTVVSQKKWVAYYELLLEKSKRSTSTTTTTALAQPIVEPLLRITRLAIRNAPTATMPPTLRLRIYMLEDCNKIVLHQAVGTDVFELEEPLEVSGSVLIEFRTFECNNCLLHKYFKVWFNTCFVSEDSNDPVVVFRRDEMDWVARDRKLRKFPAAFELAMTLHHPS